MVRGRHRRRLLVVVPTAVIAGFAVLEGGASFLQYKSLYGVWPTTAVWVLVISIALLIGAFGTPATRGRNWAIGGSGAVAVVTAACLTAALVAGGTGPTHPNAAPPPARSAVTTTAAASSSAPSGDGLVSAGDPCGAAALVSRPLPDVQVCVVYWCKGTVYRPDGTEDHRHLQIKLRPRITNNSAQPVPIGNGNPSALRLLVRSPLLPTGWSPPTRTAAAGDRPVLVQWNGEQVWAVPPNVNGDAHLTAGSYYTGFATDWHTDTVAPGSSYFSPLTYGPDKTPDETGDLVFQLPVDAAGQVDIVGFAVVTPSATPVVLAVTPRADWPQPSDPGTF